MPSAVEGPACRAFLLLAGTLAALALLGGCGSDQGTVGTTSPARTSTTPRVSHAAPDLEALLPSAVDGRRLHKGSTTGAVVFGGNAFGRVMTRLLEVHGRRPQDLRFANAQASSNVSEIEIGVFQVRGLDGSALRRAIVASSRPNAPGLIARGAIVSGRHVTKVVYPSGSTLYLYTHGDLVFYVGAPSETLAGRVIAALP